MGTRCNVMHSDDRYLEELIRLKELTTDEERGLEVRAGVPEAIEELQFDE
jgi:hypothetical protein